MIPPPRDHLRIRAAFVWLACLSMLPLGACIGRPIIGERDPDNAAMTGECEEDTMSCTDWGERADFPQVDAQVFRHEDDCGGADALQMRVDEDTELDGLDLRCATLELTVAHEVRVTLNQPRIDQARIVLISEGSATVTLLAATGNGASIETRGMSTLRLRSFAGNAGIRVDGASDTLGWDVEVEDCALTEFHARSGPNSLLLLRDTDVREAILVAGQLSMQGLTLEDGVVDAKELIASGSDVLASEIRARRGSFTAGILEGVIMHGCESMLISDTNVGMSDIGGCEAAPLELRNATVRDSIVRGRAFALQSRISKSLLGVEIGASLSLFDSRVTFSLLCTVEALAARGGSVLHCARCVPDSPQAACIDTSTAIAVVNCPVLALAEPCDGSLPEVLRDGMSATSP